MKNEVIITLGLPASGKSTFIEHMKSRMKIFDSDAYPDNIPYEKRNAAVSHDIIRFVDNIRTSLIIMGASGGEKFEETLKFFKHRFYDIVILNFVTNKETSKKLNSTRVRVVPDKAYDKCKELIPQNLKLAKSYGAKIYNIETII